MSHSNSEETSAPTIDVRQADADYQAFPTFKQWLKRTALDTARWERYTSLLAKHGELTTERLRQAQEIAKRAAAVDTGALEGLYEVDRGFTFTVAKQVAMWESVLDSKGQEVRALIESQLEAYDYVLDLATEQTPIVEAWIRDLHAMICAAQKTYLVQTEVGPQKQELPLGKYKLLSNHVYRPTGDIHSYAPVDLTPGEMHRFVSELHSEEFLQAHPILQASYAHYAFVVIHPFADGNGRVARALASIFTYRSNSIPLLILADTRAEYISALENADKGDFQPFVDFMLERALDAVQLVEQSLSAAESPPAPTALAAIKRLYTTRGGYTHTEVDQAGFSVFQAFEEELRQQANNYLVQGQVSVKVDRINSGIGQALESSHRVPVSGQRYFLQINISSTAPANAQVVRQFSLEVPRDADADDDLIIRNHQAGGSFTARVSEGVTLSAAVRMRLSIFVDKLFGEALDELLSKAAAALRGQGY